MLRFLEGAPELDQAGWAPTIGRALMLEDRSGDISFGGGYQVEYVSLDGIANGRLFDAVVASNWRYLVYVDSEAYAEIEVDQAGQRVGLHTGAGSAGTGLAFNRGEAIVDGTLVSVIVAPALKFVALRVRTDSGDHLIPYLPDQTTLQKLTMYSETEVVNELAPVAKTLFEVTQDEQSEAGG